MSGSASWAALFERAAEYEANEDEIREALAARRADRAGSEGEDE
jgi:hypothetical protein